MRRAWAWAWASGVGRVGAGSELASGRAGTAQHSTVQHRRRGSGRAAQRAGADTRGERRPLPGGGHGAGAVGGRREVGVEGEGRGRREAGGVWWEVVGVGLEGKGGRPPRHAGGGIGSNGHRNAAPAMLYVHTLSHALHYRRRRATLCSAPPPSAAAARPRPSKPPCLCSRCSRCTGHPFARRPLLWHRRFT